MRKTYITNISLQAKGDLLKLLYEPNGFVLEHNRETGFPIIPVIAEHQEQGDEVTVLAVRTNNADTPDNYKAFVNELAELGIGEDAVKVITMVEDQSGALDLKLLARIIEEIPDESLVYGDITFGTKPMSAILLYALNFIPKIKNCDVDGIYYGEIRREGGKMTHAFLYDLTIFHLLGDVIDQMQGLGIGEMQGALKKFIL
ncbi:MAG: hypothetical protein NC079_05395 [Clostridium sp.]|nr:hypothetical protein [Acetatifactor muris]MCM1527279.1 hypothetical protein [Bacteroides sp.]MCM1563027.1 hypothetical protein [Clostridium sp.]